MGKGTYSTRVADYFGLRHIASGDLVRDEIKSGSDLGREVRVRGVPPLAMLPPCPACRPMSWIVSAASCTWPPTQMAAIANAGNLLPDALIMRVIRDTFMRAHAEGTDRFLLDGFPRTADQAAALSQIADVQLAVNLGLREEVRLTGLEPGRQGWSQGGRASAAPESAAATLTPRPLPAGTGGEVPGPPAVCQVRQELQRGRHPPGCVGRPPRDCHAAAQPAARVSGEDCVACMASVPMKQCRAVQALDVLPLPHRHTHTHRSTWSSGRTTRSL